MKLWKNLFCGLLLVPIGSLLAHPTPANGSKGKKLVYEASIHMRDTPQEVCTFSVELEPTLFRIATVQNKYKAIRINIFNHSQKPLRLSLEKDAIQIRVGSRVVKGIFDLSQSDSVWWASLDLALRKDLAYPDQAAIKANEEENVFVFVPGSDLPAFPDELLFKIDNFSATPISIRRRSVAMAQ